MNKNERFIKQMFYFWNTIENTFIFYFICIGVVVIYSFKVGDKLQDALNLTLLHQFYLALFNIYILFRTLKHIFSHSENYFLKIIYSMVGFIYLWMVAADSDKIMTGFLTCFFMKTLIVIWVRVKGYSLECIGYTIEKYTIRESS